MHKTWYTAVFKVKEKSVALVPQERSQQKTRGQAAKVRLAELEDAPNVAQFLGEVREESTTPEEVEVNLEQGGALLLEGSGTLLCALLWLETPHGWTLEQPAVAEAYRDQELDRWVLTKLEALAIRRNIPFLRMKLRDEALLAYFGRMGYRLEAGRDLLLSKRVGGTWQTQGA